MPGLKSGLPALVLAGGRIGGEYAQVAGATIKALVSVAGKPVLRSVLDALHGTAGIGLVCVVGPNELRENLAPTDLWEDSAGSALGNLVAGIRRLGTPPRLLLIGSDLPMVTSGALEDFLDRAPEDSEICLPLVAKQAYLARFPAGEDVFLRLKDGRFTAGSQFLIRPEPVLRNQGLIERFFDARKSQAAMAMTVGLLTVVKFLAGQLSVRDVEEKLTRLSGCRCKAVFDCQPELAFDIDSLADLRYAERVVTG